MTDTPENHPEPEKNAEGKPTYEVGYKKPPKHGQFKPHQSGNPKGRPRGDARETSRSSPLERAAVFSVRLSNKPHTGAAGRGR